MIYVLTSLQTQKYVRIYDLVKQELVKKLLTGVKWISSIDIHPQGILELDMHVTIIFLLEF